MARSVEQRLIELYLSNLELIGEGFPAAFNRLRNRPIEELRLSELPGARDERHHLTDIRGLYSQEWEYYFIAPPVREGDVFPCCGHPRQDNCLRLELRNGFSDGQLTEREDGIIYGSLRAAAHEREDLIGKYYGTLSDDREQPVAGLNTAFVQDGIFIYVPEGVDMQTPFAVDMGYISPEERVACFPRVLIVMEAGSKCEVLLSHCSGGGGGFLVNSVCEIFVEDGAGLQLTEFSCGSENDTVLSNSFIRQGRHSGCNVTAIALGGETTRISYRSELRGEDAEIRLNGLYIACGEEKKAFSVRVDHLAPGCRSDQLVKGIAADRSEGSFTGRIYVARQAQQTSAMQQSRNIELSPQAVVYTRPQLEIYADDVRCSHGATVGRLDDDAIYYMRQRGIDLPTARRLQLEGFVKDVTDNAGFGREFFGGLVQNKIDAL